MRYERPRFALMVTPTGRILAVTLDCADEKVRDLGWKYLAREDEDLCPAFNPPRVVDDDADPA